MSEHTKGRLVAHESALGHFLLNEKEDDVAFDIKKADARRLAACWNAFDAPCMTTPIIETLVNIGGVDTLSETVAALTKELTSTRALIQHQDAIFGKKACATKECAELLAARALLREVIDNTQAFCSALECDDGFDGEEWAEKVRNYLDACDTLGDGNG